jgi:hypothetical protein
MAADGALGRPTRSKPVGIRSAQPASLDARGDDTHEASVVNPHEASVAPGPTPDGVSRSATG